ncbi:MAG: hypothetical protein WA268_13920 [Xanthobacteraceae bacterium]
MKNLVLRVGHSGERHDSTRHEIMQKAVLAVLPARLVLQLSSHDRGHDDIVGNRREDALAIFASVKVDQHTRIENQRIRDINRGA